MHHKNSTRHAPKRTQPNQCTAKPQIPHHDFKKIVSVQWFGWGIPATVRKRHIAPQRGWAGITITAICVSLDSRRIAASKPRRPPGERAWQTNQQQPLGRTIPSTSILTTEATKGPRKILGPNPPRARFLAQGYPAGK